MYFIGERFTDVLRLNGAFRLGHTFRLNDIFSLAAVICRSAQTMIGCENRYGMAPPVKVVTDSLT
jgi:hypothetical protein